MVKRILILLVLMSGFNLTSNAGASVLTASEIFSGFNAVIFGNASTTADIEGTAVIGGNFHGATVNNNPMGMVPPASFATLTVFGDTLAGNINLNNKGTAYVGGTKGANINFNGGGSYLSTPPTTSMAQIESTMKSLSSQLAGLTATSALPAPDNNEVINAIPDVGGMAVFDITVDDLAKIPSYSLQLNGADTVIFNVAGSVLDFKANYQGGDAIFDNIIWNFYEATSLTFETLIGGTILAPYASVTNKNQIDGTLVALNFNGQGELHSYSFDGDIPTSTPEPLSWMLMGGGLAGLGILRRRKARRGA